MAISKRKTLFAVVEESTAGTPLDPSSGTDFIALQDDFEMTPANDQIEDPELTSTVVVKPSINGLEQPTAKTSHKLRHSGTEGTTPAYGRLLKAAFGTETAAVTERQTTSGSTAGTAAVRGNVKLAVLAATAGVVRGKALLLKDATNGYNIRNAYSVSSNDIALGFNLAAAPASGVSCGKAIMYNTNDTKTALSLHMYRGNAGAKDVLTGAKVTSFEATIEAGQMANASYDMAGLGYYFDPIRITSSTRYIDFNDGSNTYAAVVTAQLYKSPDELATAITTAMNAMGSSDTFTCIYNSTGTYAGKFTFSTSGVALTMKWNTGANTANSIASKVGFSTAADSSASTSYNSTTAQDWAAPYTPTADSDTNGIIVKANELMIGSFNEYGCTGAASATLTIENEQFDVEDICATTGIEEKIESSRTTTLKVVLNLKQHEAKNFENYRAGNVVSAAINAGPKSGGNWVAGKCVNIYMPRCKIVEFNVSGDEIVQIEMTLQAYVEGSETSEVYLNLL
jgi:hypothetical protein